jgi:hypothetical protein
VHSACGFTAPRGGFTTLRGWIQYTQGLDSVHSGVGFSTLSVWILCTQGAGFTAPRGGCTTWGGWGACTTRRGWIHLLSVGIHCTQGMDSPIQRVDSLHAWDGFTYSAYGFTARRGWIHLFSVWIHCTQGVDALHSACRFTTLRGLNSRPQGVDSLQSACRFTALKGWIHYTQRVD